MSNREPTAPLSLILDKGAGRQLAEKLPDMLWLLNEVTAYGTYMLPRMAGEIKHEGRPLGVVDYVLLSLLRQAVAMLDAVEILVRESAVYAAFAPARGLTEASLSLEWILKADTDYRARAYYVSDLRIERAEQLSVIQGTPEHTARSDARGEIESIDPTFATTLAGLAKEATERAQKIDQLISSSPKLAEISAEFIKHRGKRPYEPQWFVVTGITSVRQMAAGLSRFAEYQYFYANASRVIHAASSRPNVRIERGVFLVENVRSPLHLMTLVRIVVTTALKTYRLILRRYRPEEESRFNAKYAEQWSSVFMTLPDIKIEAN